MPLGIGALVLDHLQDDSPLAASSVISDCRLQHLLGPEFELEPS